MTGSCDRCGTPAGSDGEAPPLGWSTATSRRGTQWLCPDCTRDHARDIEAKLDPEWWS